ncbi:restriction modification system DNA specificity domain protein [Candidatus Moduliflexus flocculans]|uniref:Restriction modification system DNA specificity domain protein n=1 Tax=Candidatus Moduliflexus flocculans TaxID=1499966 RepID=A0A0S6VYH0_9BACT|nr:restriction modification system DNA specificity domain protein [Candidatus Moduliflexus flocculans]
MTLFPETLPPADQPYPVPENWAWARLGQINTRVSKTIDPTKRPDETFELYSVPSFDEHVPEFLTGEEIKSSKQLVVEGDVLLCKINPRINRVWIVGNFSAHQKIASSEWIVITPSHEIYRSYLLWCLQGHDFRNVFTSHVAGVGGSLMRARPKDVVDYPIPVPPLPEQRRIAAKLDALLGKLREARTLIDEARESFALRRAAILHQAFSGKLTAAWRAEHPELEGAELFVHELFQGKKTYLKRKHQENSYQNIPQTWKTVELGAIVNVHSGENLTKSNMVMEGGIPVYGGNGITGYHNTYNVAQKTIVIGRVGYYCGSVHLTEEKAWITDNAFVVKFSEQQMDLTYLFWLLTYSNLGQTSNSSAQPVISGKTIYPVIVPLPPLSEQREIAHRIESLLGHETAAAALLEMDDELDLLEQSILSRAFRGELGTNDPAEPPAI